FDVPAIGADARLRLVLDDHAMIWSGVQAAIEIPAAGEIILGAGADHGWLFGAVDVNHLIALEDCEPALLAGLHEKRRPEEITFATRFQDRVVTIARRRILAPPLRV